MAFKTSFLRKNTSDLQGKYSLFCKFQSRFRLSGHENSLRYDDTRYERLDASPFFSLLALYHQSTFITALSLSCEERESSSGSNLIKLIYRNAKRFRVSFFSILWFVFGAFPLSLISLESPQKGNFCYFLASG